MNLLKTLLVYMTMVFVSSVQMAPAPTLAPATVTPPPSATVAAVIATVSAPPTASPTPVPTPDITPNSQYRTLQVGDTGDNVTLMQRRLAELGYYSGTVDGVYGNQTRRAVERFQYNNGLSADGIAGKRTLTVLYESTKVVYAPVEVTTTPAPTDTPTPASTDTPAPTFAPTPSPTPAPTPEPPATETPATATETPAADTSAAPETVTPSDAPSGAEPENATTAQTPTLLEQADFVLAGETEPLTLQNDAASALPEPVTLHPLQYGDTVMAPILEILRDAGSVILPGTDTVVWEAAFTLNENLYQFSYQVDEAGNVTELTVTKNQETQAVTDSTGCVLDDLLYLPIQTVTEVLGVTIVTDDAALRYTVTLQPAQNGENNGAAT